MMATGFSPQVGEEFLSCEADYTPSKSVEISSESESDTSSEEEELSSKPLCQEPLGSDSSSVVDAVGQMDKLEAQRLNEMVKKSCSCKLGPKGTACSLQFTREVITEQRENCRTLGNEALDMLVLGQFQAQASDTTSSDAFRQKYLTFFFQGKRICHKLFMFLHALSWKKYRNLLAHHTSHGICPREHGNLHNVPHNRIDLSVVKDVVAFIQKYAEIHASARKTYKP